MYVTCLAIIVHVLVVVFIEFPSNRASAAIECATLPARAVTCHVLALITCADNHGTLVEFPQRLMSDEGSHVHVRRDRIECESAAPDQVEHVIVTQYLRARGHHDHVLWTARAERA